MAKPNTPGCNAGGGCCGEAPPDPCEILLDDFNRADDADPGADWDEVSGTWDIGTNMLQGSGGIVTVASAPTGQSSHVSVRVKAGGTAYLYVAANSSLTSYIRARFISGASGSIQISDHTGDTGTKTVATTNGNWYTLTLCYDEATEIATATVNGESVTRTYSDVSFGDHAGIGATTSHDFDDFEWRAVDEECEVCSGVSDCACCEDGGGHFYDIEVLATYATDSCDEEVCDLPTTFRCRPIAACRWQYLAFMCLYPGCGSFEFSVIAQVVGDCDLQVFVRMISNGGDTCIDAGDAAIASAIYIGTGAGFFTGACAGPLVLTLDSSAYEAGVPSGTMPPCNPTWPATITMTRV